MIIMKETKGMRLRSKLQSCRLSKEEFARKTGIDLKKVSLYMDDLEEMSAEDLKKAANILNTSVNYLQLASNSDISERYLAMIQGIAPETEEEKLLNSMLYQKARVKEYLHSMGVSFVCSMRIQDKKYYCDYIGDWIDENGEEVYIEDLLNEMRKNSEDSEYITNVSYRGRIISLDEEQLNSWLCNIGNMINIQLQTMFGINDNMLLLKAVDDDITMALKGLPAHDRSIKLDQASA